MFEELGGGRIIDRIDRDGPVDGLTAIPKHPLDYFEEENDRYAMFTREEIDHDVPEETTEQQMPTNRPTEVFFQSVGLPEN